MSWRWVRAFPKYALIFGVIFVSTAAFLFYWFVLRPPKVPVGIHAPPPPAPVEDIGPKLALLEAKHERLLLVDNDLYDLDSGAVIFKNWLNKPMPLELFYDSKAKKFIGHYERGFCASV